MRNIRMSSIFLISLRVRIVFFLLLGFILFSGFRAVTNSTQNQTKGSTEIPSIAVLPFVNMSTDKSQDYFSDGMAEEILNALAKIEGLRVAARTSSFTFKERNKDIPTIGERLNVDYVFEGSVRKDSTMVRISVQLIKVEDGFHLWSNSYDREFKSVFVIQDEISRAIVSALKVELVGAERSSLVEAPTANMDAYESYLKGRFFWNQRGSGLKKGAIFFEQAIEKDPSYAYAYAGLADTYSLFGFYGFLPPDESFPKAKVAAMKALQLNYSIAEAHSSLGMVRLLYEMNWAAAGKDFKRAIEINPYYVPARYWYALYLSMQGQFDDALFESDRALRADPLSIMANAARGWILLGHHKFALAKSQLLKTLELDPTFALAHLLLGQVYIHEMSFDKGVAQLQKAVASSGNSAWTLASLGWAYAQSGQKDKARKILTELIARKKVEYVQSNFIALVYLGLGEKEKSIDWLEKALNERAPWLVVISHDPIFEPLQSDSRFKTILRSVGL